MNGKPSFSQPLDMTSRSTLLAYALLGVLIVAGAFHVWWYRDLPIVRNSLIYAQICNRLVEPGHRFSPDSDAYTKAIGFPAVSLPFVQTWGANVGLKMSSWLWTSLWAVSVVALFARLRERLGLGRQHLWLVLLLTLFSPLAFYQFMSAYPDTLIAVTFLWSLYFLDRTLSRESRWFDGLLFSLTVLTSVWVKHMGLIMIPILIAFLLVRGDQLPALWRERRVSLVTALVSAAIVALTLVAARQGRIPLFNLDTVTQNYTQEWEAPTASSGNFLADVLRPNLLMLATYFLVTLGICTPLLCWPRRLRKNLEWYVTAAIVIIAIVVYKGSPNNPRYLLTIAPLLAAFAAATLLALSRGRRLVLIGLFIVVNAYSTAYYNSIGFHDFADRVAPLRPLDNLRLTGPQRDRQTAIEQVNKLAQAGANRLIVVSGDAGYYGDASFHVLDPLFDARLRIQYQGTWDPSALAEMGPEPVVVVYWNSDISITAQLDGLGKRVSDAVWIVRSGAHGS